MQEYVTGARGRQKWALLLLELELQVAVCCHVMLDLESRASGRTSIPNHGTISPAPYILFRNPVFLHLFIRRVQVAGSLSIKCGNVSSRHVTQNHVS